MVAGVLVVGGVGAVLATEASTRVARDLAERLAIALSADAAVVAGAAVSFGVVVSAGLWWLRAPRWSLGLPGAAMASVASFAASRWASSHGALGVEATFQRRADALARASGGAGDVAAAGLAIAALLLGWAAFVAGGERPSERPTARPREAPSGSDLPGWAIAAGAVLMGAWVATILGRRWSVGAASRVTVMVALPCALALAGAFRSRRGRPDPTAALGALALGAAAVVSCALAVAALQAWSYAEVVGAVDAGRWVGELSADSRGLVALGAGFLLPLLPAAAVVLRRTGRVDFASAPVGVVAVLVVAPLAFAATTARGVLGRVAELGRRHATLVEHPGEPVVDDELSAGTLMVELVPAFDALPLEATGKVVGSNGGRKEWAPDRAAAFEGLSPDAVGLSVDGPYVAADSRVTLAAGSGARVAIPAIGRGPAGPPQIFSDDGPSSALEIDIGAEGPVVLRWMSGPIPVFVDRVSRAELGDAGASLAARIERLWKAHGWHRDPNDRKLDRARVFAPAGAPFDAVRTVVGAVLATQRERRTREGRSVQVSVFEVAVTTPPPPRVVVVDDRAERIAALAAKRPEGERSATLLEAVGACRWLTCSPPVYARLWLAVGEALADEASPHAADAFARARLVEPSAEPSGAASAAARTAFEEAVRRKPSPVVIEPPTVSGRVDPKLVAAALEPAEGVIRLCVDLAPPGGDGRVEVRIAVGRDGAVHHRRRGDLDPSGTEGCIARALERLTLPVPEGGIATVGLRVRSGESAGKGAPGGGAPPR